MISTLIVGVTIWIFGMQVIGKLNLAMVFVGPLVSGTVLYMLHFKGKPVYGLLTIAGTMIASAVYFFRMENLGMIMAYYGFCMGIVSGLEALGKKLKGTPQEPTWNHFFGTGGMKEV